ncbi:MAG TPA: hypothetical protein H9784_07990 [Candidatus Desulfovibrio intestinavium]|uniref:Uncharacterized protein n=1 Tax=Candidatus Desulfovibrio intestinavium TaxID=2838534 RepID=A0A9D2KS25_9BACT|nr:hypothetical protein [Candidatus Desulfovibrio intestinavium]
MKAIAGASATLSGRTAGIVFPDMPAGNPLANDTLLLFMRAEKHSLKIEAFTTLFILSAFFPECLDNDCHEQ